MDRRCETGKGCSFLGCILPCNLCQYVSPAHLMCSKVLAMDLEYTSTLITLEYIQNQLFKHPILSNIAVLMQQQCSSKLKEHMFSYLEEAEGCSTSPVGTSKSALKCWIGLNPKCCKEAGDVHLKGKKMRLNVF